jgi:hypothetical protein
MNAVTVGFYVIVFLGLVQIDRRLYDIAKTLKTLREAQSKFA